MGLQESFAYARSLARFAANLGPVAWKVASKKIEYVLPLGTEYGPGWVAENGATASQPPPFPNTPDFRAPDLSPSVPHGLSEEMVEAVRRLNSQNERGLQSNTSPWKTPFPPVQQNHMYHQPQIQRNGFGGMPGYDAQTSRLSVPAIEGFQFPSQAINPMLQEMPAEGEMWTFGRSSWPAVPAQHGRSLAAPPDLNMRVLAGSPSSNLQIGSPQQQPDLALQL